MKKCTTILLSVLLICQLAHAQENKPLAKKDPRLHSDGGPWKFYRASSENASLPRVLLIGDSIMNGYRGSVYGLLKGKANVDVWLTPRHLKSEHLHADLQKVLDQGPYEVIHFNIGLHGWPPGRIPEGQYEPLMRSYVEVLRAHSEQVRLIWGSTTQITVKGKPTELDPVHNSTIVKRNKICAKVMRAYGIPVNDLYGSMSDKLQMARGDKFHWNGSAYQLMAEQISQCISRALGSPQAQMPVFYVSVDGADSNAGTKQQPFRTLEKARAAVRKAQQEGRVAIVYLRGGVYERSATFELNEQDAGSVHAPVIWRAHPGEEVTILGGRRIAASLAEPVTDSRIRRRIVEASARPKVLQVDLKSMDIVDYGKLRARGFRRPYIPAHMELFIDNHAMRLAQWPNPGEARVPIGKVLDRGSIPRTGDFSNRGGKFHYDTDRVQHWRQADDIWISGFFNHGYADDTVQIKHIDHENRSIETVQAHMYGYKSGNAWNRWVALNLLEEIDLPGEYFCDTKTGILYFYPLPSFNPKTSVLNVSVLEAPLLALEGASFVHFNDISFECTRGMGIYIERGAGCRINGCTLRNMGMVAVCIGQGTEDLDNYAHEGTARPASRRLGNWHEHIYRNTVFDRQGGKGHGIVSCDISNMGAGGIHLGGGDRATLRAAGNFVRNCDIHDYNRLGRSYKAGVNVDGVGNRVEYCRIHSAPACAFYVHGNDHVFEYNEVHDVMLDGDDMGAFYLGRDPSEFGNTLRHNFFHHIGRTPRTHRTWCIYYDDMACGNQAIGNVFYEAGKSAAFLIGGGKYNVTRNNIFINSGLGIQMGNRGQGWAKNNLDKGGLFEERTLNAVDITKPPYRERYPQLANYWDDTPAVPANPTERNLLVNCGKVTNARTEWGPFKNNWSTETDPGFVNMAEGNFALTEDASVYTQIPGFEPVPFSRMGLFTDPWRKAIPKRKGFAQQLEPAKTDEAVFDPYHLIWDSLGTSSLDSMPIGNGDIGLNVWTEQNGDLVFYVSKTDAWSENGRLLKLGKLRVSLSPNPFANSNAFTQALSVKEGMITLTAGGPANAAKLIVWVDAMNPAINIDIKSKKPVDVTASFEPWRTKRRELTGNESHSAYGIQGKGADPIFVEPDIIVEGQHNRIIWYHRNNRSIWKANLELQALGAMTGKLNDPLLNRTFGALMQGEGLISRTKTVLQSAEPQTHCTVSIYPLTKQTDSAEAWIAQVKGNASRIGSKPYDQRMTHHVDWWTRFWDRSYIHVTSADAKERSITEKITRGYILQRWMNACSGRGNSPIKFNGSIFTVDTMKYTDRFKGFDADYRQWGGPYWWQNTRLPYWSMLSSGDHDLMTPLFKQYHAVLPMRRAATQTYYGHDGAFIPETMYFWGTYTDSNYGRDRTNLPVGLTENRFIRYYWQSGLELSLMMLDHYSHTRDRAFARDILLPFAQEIITFYDQHWGRNTQGKIHFEPAMALETYRKAVNPLVEIVGIEKVCRGLLSLPDSIVSKERSRQWQRLISELPDVPMRNIDGKKVLSPAQEFSEKQNVENPEMYAVFPYRAYGVGKPDIDIACNTFARRVHKNSGGWQQNAIQAAFLGLADEAAKLVAFNFTHKNARHRFDAMWGPNYDWTPDQDHGGVAMTALQRMLLQYEGDEIHLLPAWPRKWNVEFKLHAPDKTVVQGVYRSGRLQKLNCTPNSRKKDVQLENTTQGQ
jgi:alpha-L-fucosidase 2